MKPVYTAHIDPQTLLLRARAYVAQMPTAVAGAHGHTATFKVAVALVHGFGLEESDALPIMEEYSSRCSPPWKREELEHKLRSAAQNPEKWQATRTPAHQSVWVGKCGTAAAGAPEKEDFALPGHGREGFRQSAGRDKSLGVNPKHTQTSSSGRLLPSPRAGKLNASLAPERKRAERAPRHLDRQPVEGFCRRG